MADDEKVDQDETEDVGAAQFAITDEEIELVRGHIATLGLRHVQSTVDFPVPSGMDSARFNAVLLRRVQQADGNLFASVDEAFSHTWVEFVRSEFDAMLRVRKHTSAF